MGWAYSRGGPNVVVIRYIYFNLHNHLHGSCFFKISTELFVLPKGKWLFGSVKLIEFPRGGPTSVHL